MAAAEITTLADKQQQKNCAESLVRLQRPFSPALTIQLFNASRWRSVRSLNLDCLSHAHEQIILESQPEALCLTAFLKIGSGESSWLEAFAVDDHQLLPFLFIQQMNKAHRNHPGRHLVSLA